MKTVLSLVLMVTVVNTPSQVESSGGTALVATVTKNEITLAQDSRHKRDGVYLDDDCKIITLNGKIIFGFSGLRRFHVTQPDINWESHAAANRAFEISSDKTAAGAAEQFAILAKDAFGNVIKAMGLKRFLRETGAHPKSLSLGVFIGLNNVSKQPEAFKAEISYSIPKQIVDKEVAKITPPEFPLFQYFAAGSDPSTATEFGSITTFRASMEYARWKQTMVGKTTDEMNSLFAVQLVKWEILYTKEPGIGGEVDYMVLTPAGITDHRKPSCQTNQ
jgi:hypothetical protein